MSESLPSRVTYDIASVTHEQIVAAAKNIEQTLFCNTPPYGSVRVLHQTKPAIVRRLIIDYPCRAPMTVVIAGHECPRANENKETAAVRSDSATVLRHLVISSLPKPSR